jgi:hypothetical protein
MDQQRHPEKGDERVTEHEMQNALRHGFVGDTDLSIPNNCAFGWEADLIIVRKSLFTVEVEIKVTVSDFRHDAKKVEKHQALETGMYDWMPWRDQPREQRPHVRPNYFYYALPDSISGKIDVPKYAGLLVVRKRRRSYDGEIWYDYEIEISKKAPRLHNEKLGDKERWQIMRSYDVKYWNNRIKTESKEVAA